MSAKGHEFISLRHRACLRSNCSENSGMKWTAPAAGLMQVNAKKSSAAHDGPPGTRTN
jgi:hypothetical protein